MSEHTIAYVPNELLGRLVGRRMYGVFFLPEYVQLWFDGDMPSGTNVSLGCDVFPRVALDGRTWGESDTGYGDALRGLVNAEVIAAVATSGEGLVLSFATGQIVINPTWHELVGPEIAMLSGFEDGAWMVWRPGEDSFEQLAHQP
jgi:hypothetical protein